MRLHVVVDEFVHHTLANLRENKLPYDGVIARANKPLFSIACKQGISIVNVGGNSPVRDKMHGVFPDTPWAGQLAAEHLLARGFRNFATISPPKKLATRSDREGVSTND